MESLLDYGAIGTVAAALAAALAKLHAMHAAERKQWFDAWKQLQKESNHAIQELSILIHAVVAKTNERDH